MVKHEVIRANPPGLLLACCLQGYSLNQTILKEKADFCKSDARVIFTHKI